MLGIMVKSQSLDPVHRREREGNESLNFGLCRRVQLLCASVSSTTGFQRISSGMSQGLRSEDMFDNAQDESAVRILNGRNIHMYLLLNRSETQVELPPPNELVTAVDRLLNELGPKFSKMSTELFAKSKHTLYT